MLHQFTLKPQQNRAHFHDSCNEIYIVDVVPYEEHDKVWYQKNELVNSHEDDDEQERISNHTQECSLSIHEEEGHDCSPVGGDDASSTGAAPTSNSTQPSDGNNNNVRETFQSSSRRTCRKDFVLRILEHQEECRRSMGMADPRGLAAHSRANSKSSKRYALAMGAKNAHELVEDDDEEEEDNTNHDLNQRRYNFTQHITKPESSPTTTIKCPSTRRRRYHKKLNDNNNNNHHHRLPRKLSAICA